MVNFGEIGFSSPASYVGKVVSPTFSSDSGGVV